jgi:AAA domain
MIKSITLENFMSHQATRIELDPGVTVITGPNNVGKSAVVEAVRSLIQNPSQKYSIRHGAKQAVVRLELDSGEIIEWVRTDRTAYYRLLRPQANGQEEACDPEEYRKIGLTVPEDIQALLRLGRVETETGDIDIHIGNQRDPIFLLNSPGSHAAGFFAASTEAEYLLRMRQTLKSRVDYARTTSKVLAGECLTLEKALSRYQPLEGLESELEQAEETYELICRNQKSLPELSEFIGNLADQERTLGNQQQSVAIFEGLGLPPELQEIVGLEAFLQHWRQITGKTEAATARLQILNPLSFHPLLKETASLAHLSSRLAETEKMLKQRRREQETLVDLTEPSALTPVSDLKNLAEAIRRLDLTLATNQSLSRVFHDIQEPPVIHELLPFEQLLVDLGIREAIQNRDRRRQETLAVIGSPPELVDVGDLLIHIANLSWLQAKRRFLESLSGTLAGLAAGPKIAPIPDLEELIRQTKGIMQALSRQQQERDSLEDALEQKRTGVEELIRETGICPLCGSPMDVAHFMEGMHA